MQITTPFRGHMGGLLGGALAAFLLGPHFVVETVQSGGRRSQVLVDKPPIPLFALQPRTL